MAHQIGLARRATRVLLWPVGMGLTSWRYLWRTTPLHRVDEEGSPDDIRQFAGTIERLVTFAREHDVLVVHDASYTETTFDGYVAPSFLETPGAKEVGVEIFSLSKGWNMTGWRTAAIVGNAEAVGAYWRLKTNIDSGMFEAVQLAGAAALDAGPPAGMAEIYARRRDLVCDALSEIGVNVTPPKGSIYVWAPVPDGHTSASYCEMVLEESAVVISPGSAYGPNGEGFFRISLTIDDERLQEAVERLRGSLSR
jgi:LL-diaminopimelate aminotransferase